MTVNRQLPAGEAGVFVDEDGVLGGPDTANNGGFTVNVAATSSTVLAANSKRKSALIINYSDTLVWLMLGSPAVAGQGIPLAPRVDADNPGGSFEIDASNLYTGIITAIHEGAGNKAVVGTEV